MPNILLQELMLRGADFLDVLRLLVLLNEAGHGLPRKALDSLRSEVLISYGHEYMLTLDALEKAGFLRQASPGRSPFTSLVRRAFQLIMPEPELPASAGPHAFLEVPPTDISHVYKVHIMWPVAQAQLVSNGKLMSSPFHA